MSKKVTRLFDFPQYQLETYNLDNAFNTKYNGEWVATSTKEFIEKANAVSRGLLKLGVKPGDKIAIASTNNRTEWNILDIGILQIGAIGVPIYPTITKDDFEYIFNHAEVSLCFISDEELYKTVSKVKKKVPTLQEIYCFEEVKKCKNWEEIIELGKDESTQPDVQKIMDSVNPEDLATIIYTSGTTGKPKGVMLSHSNIVSNTLDCQKVLPMERGNFKSLSFSPVCHIFERMLLYYYQYAGGQIYFAEAIDKIGDNLKEVKPDFMTVVPRLLEKVYDGIINKGSELKGIKKALFFWAVDLGLKWEPYEKNGWWYHLKLKIADKLIFSKWREALGGNLRDMVSGSAALQPRLAKVFSAAGMTIVEGYGLSETSPVISVNMYKNNMMKVGSVGKIIDNVHVKIAEDGEILVKGPNVMMGYYKDPERTASVMTGDYFHTGDKGELDENGFLTITGRKKEIFKTSGGKYIVPALLENSMKESRFIEQATVIGEGQKLPAAIIQPAFDFLREWARIHNLPIPDNNEDLIADPQVIARIEKEIKKANKRFGKWERIKKFELTPDLWGIENGLLTPTMKPKRDEILKKYKDLYNKIYENNLR